MDFFSRDWREKIEKHVAIIQRLENRSWLARTFGDHQYRNACKDFVTHLEQSFGSVLNFIKFLEADIEQHMEDKPRHWTYEAHDLPTIDLMKLEGEIGLELERLNTMAGAKDVRKDSWSPLAKAGMYSYNIYKRLVPAVDRLAQPAIEQTDKRTTSFGDGIVIEGVVLNKQSQVFISSRVINEDVKSGGGKTARNVPDDWRTQMDKLIADYLTPQDSGLKNIFFQADHKESCRALVDYVRTHFGSADDFATFIMDEIDDHYKGQALPPSVHLDLVLVNRGKPSNSLASQAHDIYFSYHQVYKRHMPAPEEAGRPNTGPSFPEKPTRSGLIPTTSPLAKHL